jgi:glycosyltransferase involved in cell wall biosynthesis
MRIVLISKYSILPQFGAPNRQYFISKYLSQQPDADVLLIGSKSTLAPVPDFKGLYHSVSDGHLEMVTLTGPVVDPGFNLKRLLSWFVFEYNIFRFRKKIRAFKPDIVIVSSLSILTFLTGIFLKKWLRIPLVVEVRDIHPLTIIEVGKKSPYNPAILFLKFVEKLGYKNADLIVSPLPNANEHIRTVIKKDFRFFWLPQGVDLKYYEQPKKMLPFEIIERKPGDFIIGYAGTLGKANALDVIFEAAGVIQHTHPNIKFLFVGDGPLKDNFREKYKNLGNIYFVPAVSKIDLQQVFEKVDLVINTWLDIPIYRFGINPNKWIDYMYAAKPILVGFSGKKSIIEEAGCGLVVPAENTEALVKGIIQFSEMTNAELVMMGQRGKNYLVNKLSYEILTADFYRELLSVKNRSGILN